ncbi:MAG: response regulator, partial [Bdellovibrionales bacterium]|nr:response regulator [Bdellovibrionales bacterium]
MKQRVLFVDDEPNILQTFKRHLRGTFEVDVALSAEIGLRKLRESGPYAVVVSDMRMPGMNGVEFLRSARSIAPLTARIMLTGNADQETATQAVNDGSVFRFLNKPCSSDEIASSVFDASEKYRKELAQQELLEQTLQGSVNLLYDILGAVEPKAYQRGMRMRELVSAYAEEFSLPQRWNAELAAMLSSIGWVTLPPDILSKLNANRDLADDEQALVERMPETARNLLRNVPRLKQAGEIVYYSAKRFDGSGFPHDEVAGAQLPKESRLLKIIGDLVVLNERGAEMEQAFEILRVRSGWYDPALLTEVHRLFTATTVDAATVRLSADPEEL